MALHKPMVAVKLPSWRRRLLLVLVLLGFIALLGRAVYLQGFHKRFLQERGDERYNRTLTLHAHRGKIFDRNGELLADSAPVESVWANPSDVQIDAARIKKIAELLNVKVAAVEKKLVHSEREFVYLKRRVAPEVAAEVMKLNVPGIYLQREYKRQYPAGDVTAHLVGFTGIDDKGQEGFELTMNSVLSGKDGSRRVIKDRAGRIVEDLEAVRVPQDGHDVVLSIDRRIQYLAHRELSKSVEKFKAKAGAAVVLDAQTGEVLAMVNLPTYNPNNPVNIVGKTRNRAITDMFEPGSTMKPITVAAALEKGEFKPETMVETAPGRMTIGSATIHDAHPHGLMSVSEVIQKSSNVGSAKIALTLDKEYMWGIFNLIGFGAKTRVGFPGEASGQLRNFKTWRPIEQATMSYGHGISVTLLQLARAYTVFANDGELKPVSLLKLKEAPVGTQVFTAKSANAMRDMLELVVLPGGTALKAQVLGYRVAGKTGTTVKLGERGYEKGKYVGSFIGMAPASNPRLIMAVMIDDPSTGEYYGGTVAAPVFSAVMADSLRILSVPQDAPNNNVVIPSAVLEVQESI
ncbi:MAG: penicillin-binding protein 2 [Betaproteobacteria bacterium]|nr:penicillin-binding protein 2 [Betaproteobacteria bacterium]